MLMASFHHVNQQSEGEARMSDMEIIPLLTPYRMGPWKLSHRVVLAPLSRCRSFYHIPQLHAALYYSQRASPGGLLIAEATAISETALGLPHSPGIWSEQQVEAWKPIVKAVHDKGAIFFLQICHVGRASTTAYQPGGRPPVSSTNKRISGTCLSPSAVEQENYSVPRALAAEEIPGIINDFRVAARNAVSAGFDGVEIHGAYGYLIDQFLKNGVNERTDSYGGSLQNRCRFALEVVAAVVHEIGRDHVGIRLSPFSSQLDCSDSNPEELSLYLASALSKYKIAYAHYLEPRGRKYMEQLQKRDLLQPARKAFNGTFIVGGGYNRDSGNEAIRSGKADLVSFGRLFLSNPDLPQRFKLSTNLNECNEDTFYTQDAVVGYTDYPFLK